MNHVVVASEPSDCWTLVGVDDGETPPMVARLIDRAGSRNEWRRAGLPVLFDEQGLPRPIQRGGRVYRFEPVDADRAARLPHPTPFHQPSPSPLNE